MKFVKTDFRFRGGNVALDLAATLAGRKRAQTRELLAEPGDLASWLVLAGVAMRKPRVTAVELRRARKLREAIYRMALARARKRAIAEVDRALLNRCAAVATPSPRLERGGIRSTRETVSGLLSIIARSAINLFGGGERIGQCGGDGCALLFVDTSRAGHRKWCSMSGCGNKAKVASFRDRLRT
jgi:predicted RNA-binding Zn ribbon-like protein